MSPTIRRATTEDEDFVAWTILTAQRGHRPRGYFDFALNLPDGQCRAFVRHVVSARTLSQWHLSHFWIAERDGEAAAALCALPVGEARQTVRPAIEEAARAAGFGESDLAAMWRRSAYAKLCWSWADDADWMIEHVATLPSHRGHGLVKALLDHALRSGQANRFKRASIGFYIGNDVAERCYARAGFRYAEEKRHPDFETLTGAPGFRRFERDL